MKEKKVYRTLGIVLLVFVLIAVWLKWRYDLQHNYILYGVCGVGFILLSFDTLAKLFVRNWMALGRLLGNINASIILSVVFIVLLVPLALIKKLTAKKTVNSDSNWAQTEEEYNFNNPW